jgi:hypothetical protein
MTSISSPLATPTVTVRGNVRDALDQRHEVEEQIDIAEWWERLGEATHRWEENPVNRLIGELEKIRAELDGIRRQLPRLALASEREPNA